MCTELCTTPLSTKEYHTRINEQVEQYNATFVSRLHQYGAQQQQDWDRSVTSLTYAYNFQVDRSKKLTPLSFILSRHPPGRASLQTITAPQNVSDIVSPLAMRIHLINCTALVRRLADKNLIVTQQRFKSDHDKKVRLKSQMRLAIAYFSTDCF